MKRSIFHLSAILLLTVGAFAADADVTLQFPAANISHVLDYYERLAGRKVWLATDVANIAANETVKVVIEKPVPREEAARLIRAALL